jgi:hypothetical protein
MIYIHYSICTYQILTAFMMYLASKRIAILFEILHFSLETFYLFLTSIFQLYQYQVNRIGGVMVSVLASIVIDRGFEPWSGQTKNYKIGICCFSSKYAELRR